MTPKSFDIDTAKEWVGDARMRHIENKARADADLGNFAPPHESAETYAGQVAAEMVDVVYLHAFKKRMERIARIAERNVI